MERLKKVIYLLVVFNFVAILYILLKPEENALGYFKSAEVYNSFDYKIELEKDLKQYQTKNQMYLDSLENDYKITIATLNNIQPSEDEYILLDRKQRYLFETKEKLENEYSSKVSEFYELIWSRINAYAVEYGETNNYQYIFGANGDGSVMYADEGQDITSELLEFINKKYAGE